MNEMVATSSASVSQRQRHTAWYRAMTLAERLASLREHASTQSLSAPSDDQGARQRLQRWKDQIPFDRDDYFVQRLSLDGLNEEDLLALLAESPEALQARVSTAPLWLQTLMKAFEEPQSEFVEMTTQTKGDLTWAYFATLRPLIKGSMTRLQAGLQELLQEYPHLPFESTTIILLLVQHLPSRLVPKLLKTYVLELNVARVQGHLQGETPQERFQYFLQQLSRPEGILPLLEEYSVLARRLVETLESWVTCSLELLERLCADWEEICATFPQACDAGKLIEILPGKGDLHRGGRSVTILTWSSGFRLVYKPRSMAIDVHFQELLSWLNAQGYSPTFRICQVINRQAYGWAEFIQVSSCTSKEEVEHFYQRQGGYLALLYAMEASDFFAENLIAAGEHPILIDLEALLQPRQNRQAAQNQSYPGLETINHSVWRVGLLPWRAWFNRQSEGVDVSGLGGQEGQFTPVPILRLAEAGSDEMKFSSERVPLPASQHRPRLHGQDVDTLEYRDSIISGFISAYRLLLAHRDELVQEILPRFAHDEVRCLLRQTQIYSKLLADCFHPSVLRDALECDRLFDRLWINVEQKPHLARVIVAERADLWAGDVPMFMAYPESRDLFTSTGERISEFFATPSLEMAKQRVGRFSERDMEKQIWIIQASFSSMAHKGDQTAKRGLQLHPSHTEMSHDRLIAAACAIGDRLERLAEYQEDMVGWLDITVTSVNERGWDLLPTGLDLYSGLPGLAFFLSYLGLLTGEQRYTALAQAALKTMRSQIIQRKAEGTLGRIGVFGGVSSCIYVLSHLGTLWNDSMLYREAEELVALLPEAIGQDVFFDVIGGAAGCIAALLSLYAVAPSQATLEVALQCGDHLIASAQPQATGIGWSSEIAETPLAGFSHGNAGIALCLLQLFAVSGEERFRQTALEAIAYERSLFSPEKQNWPDLRPSSVLRAKGDGEDDAVSYMAAWCHGAPGIALARLGSLSVLQDAEVNAEIDAALRTTIAQGFGRNHSLCHGDMGNLDILLSATQLLANPRYIEGIQEVVQRIAPMLLDSIETRRWISGVPHGIETPGLMVGLAGIGYVLLRLAAPEGMPSVLLLAPPR